VSRRGFRARVDAPRPASAWVLVAVASAAIWITGQLALPVIAVQVAALALAFACRAEPLRWQRGPLALHAGMFAIVGGTVRAALGGAPSTAALPHLAALAPALHLPPPP